MNRISASTSLLLVFAIALASNLTLAAGTINGDGLAYWSIVRSSDWTAKFLPGHLLYCPLQTVFAAAVQVVWPEAGLARLMLLVNQLAGAAAVSLVFACARQFGWNRFACWLAALGVCFSFGVWVQTTDVEVYALTLLCVTLSIYIMACYARQPTLVLAAALGAANSLAALFHLATITLGAASVLLLVIGAWPNHARAAKALAVYFATSLICFGLPACAIGFGVLHLPSFGALLVWLKTSEHGYQVVFDAQSIARAIYGFARTFLFLEFFWTAPKWLLAVKGLALVLMGGTFVWLWARGPDRIAGTARIVLGCLLGFVVFQVVLGAYYFGSDTERWIFLTPLVWLTVAGIVSCWTVRRKLLASAVFVIMALVNLVQGIGPLSVDHAIEAKICALDQRIQRDALVIAPGEDWLGWYFFYQPHSKRPERVTIFDLAMRHRIDRDVLFGELRQRIEAAQAAGREVWLIRILDPTENGKDSPWQQLEAFGYTSHDLHDWFARYSWEEQRLDDPVRTFVYRLRPGELAARK